MGTRGLLFIRCRGRYFVYYNQFDSYPEGLGDAIVQNIPEDPEKYHEWLESMRKQFSALVQKRDEQYLPLALSNSPEPEDSTSDCLAQRYMKSFLAIDDRLQIPPVQTLLPKLWEGPMIEWMYTLDLDRELLGVDHSVYFKLSRIPHGGHWHQYLGLDDQGRRVLEKDTPEDIIGDVTWTPRVKGESKAKYDALDIEEMPSTAFIGASDTPLPREALLLNIFACLQSNFRKLLDVSLLQWTPECFSFREIAFAVLSIAAGDMTFESVQALDRTNEKEGYYLHPDGSLLPRFLYERHIPGIEPGSAPQGLTYWFGSVLVHLASRLDLLDVEKAAVAEVVNVGLAQGRREFYAMVFSISDVIMVHVHREDSGVRIQRSYLMHLFYFDDENSRYSNGPRTKPAQDHPKSTLCTDIDPTLQRKALGEDPTDSVSDEDDAEEPLPENKKSDSGYTTFLFMIRFFGNAAQLQLAGAKSRTVPNEILTFIMHFADTQTYKNLASVSASCRQLSDHKFRLNDDYDVVGSDANTKGYSHRFIVEDTHSGRKMHSEIMHCATMDRDWWSDTYEANALELYPVIGGGDTTSRRSVIGLEVLRFSKVPPKDTPCTKRGQSPVSEFYYSSFNRLETQDSEKLFEIPDYQYPGFVENAWGKYIRKMIQQESFHSQIAEYVQIGGAQYRCLLPPRYRELEMSHFFCNGLQAFVRHPQDESPDEWMQTIEYAVQQLSRLESYPRYSFLVMGHPVIVAFGTRVKLFYYIYHGDDAPVVPPKASSINAQLAASYTDPDPKHRLVPLIPGSEPIDVREGDGRVKLEEWFKIFCDKQDYKTEWDPITGEYRPLAQQARDANDTE
ncbi:hypothetical protein BDV28DRAFT_134461 [Aspergillus coremiiformis]|uniref:Uncharacterized protein n=1 Tax=Aspergillus coremiiformis TaxID=138285 RepID=A0A5N6Z577_9EURO|nr:hypothetical protein BDV28DRAFT_134461 [Aspergillus coremiiformis]